VRYADLLVWDTHVCLPIRPEGRWSDQLERHRAAGATLARVNLGEAELPFSDDDARGIVGENFMLVAEAAWR